MKKAAIATLTVGALAAGAAVGVLLATRNHPSRPQTTITLSPIGQTGRCSAHTEHQNLKARREAPIRWHLAGTCQLASGGVVQLRFTVLPSPTAPAAPTQQGNSRVILAWTTRDADATRIHKYTVYADFPGDENDYPMEDPDLEIVTYGRMRSLLSFW